MDMVKIPVDAHRKVCLETAAQMVKRYADTAPKGAYTVEKTYFALHTFYAVVSDNGEKEILCRGERTATFVAALTPFYACKFSKLVKATKMHGNNPCPFI